MPTAFTELVGCTHPLQLAGMGGATSPDLAMAVSRAGGLGMLSGTAGVSNLRVQLDAVPPDVVVGVNFLLPFLDPAALEEAARRVRLVELFWGDPDDALIAAVHDGGALAGWQVGSGDEAAAAVDAGCDLVVAQGVEAGGHVRGKVALLTLIAAVRRRVGAVPVVAAGGIGTGEAMARALMAGADAVRIGTRFVAATESVAHPDYVDALIAARADDTVLTTAFGQGWPNAPHRVLRSAVTAGEALGADQAWSPNWPTTGETGSIAARALYAGRSVSAVVRRQPAAEIVAELVADAEAAMAGQGGGRGGT